jgi:hypothetical protein
MFLSRARCGTRAGRARGGHGEPVTTQERNHDQRGLTRCSITRVSAFSPRRSGHGGTRDTTSESLPDRAERGPPAPDEPAARWEATHGDRLGGREKADGNGAGAGRGARRGGPGGGPSREPPAPDAARRAPGGPGSPDRSARGRAGPWTRSRRWTAARPRRTAPGRAVVPPGRLHRCARGRRRGRPGRRRPARLLERRHPAVLVPRPGHRPAGHPAQTSPEEVRGHGRPVADRP